MHPEKECFIPQVLECGGFEKKDEERDDFYEKKKLSLHCVMHFDGFFAFALMWERGRTRKGRG